MREAFTCTLPVRGGKRESEGWEGREKGWKVEEKGEGERWKGREKVEDMRKERKWKVDEKRKGNVGGEREGER